MEKQQFEKSSGANLNIQQKRIAELEAQLLTNRAELEKLRNNYAEPAVENRLKLFKFEFLAEVNKSITKRLLSISATIACIGTLLSFLGYATIKELLISQIDINSIKEKVLVAAEGEIKNITQVKDRVLILENEFKTNVDFLKMQADSFKKQVEGDLTQISADLSASTEAIGNRVFSPDSASDTKAEILVGWTFFAQKKKGVSAYSAFAFKIVAKSQNARTRKSLYPYKDDRVECLNKSWFVRTGFPSRSVLKPPIGSLKKGGQAMVFDVKEVRDKNGNLEVWIKIQPVSGAKIL